MDLEISSYFYFEKMLHFEKVDLYLEVAHRAFGLNAPLLAKLHHPSAKLVGHVHRGLLAVHVDHVDVVDVPVGEGERRRRCSETVALKCQTSTMCYVHCPGSIFSGVRAQYFYLANTFLFF